MSNTVTDLVDNFNLKKEVDWGLLGVIADSFREEGEELLADYLQWSTENTVLFDSVDHTVLGPIYSFLWIVTNFCGRILVPSTLDYLVPSSAFDVVTRSMYAGRFYNYFVWVYLQTVVPFMKLSFRENVLDVILPDCCISLTNKMWPGYDCKGKTLGQIKQELSRD